MSGERHIYSVLQECVHACLPKLYDVTIADGTTTVIEEYVEGRSLGMVKLSAKQFRCVVGDLCSVLEYLHGKGIIHRDIKPSNIIYKEDGHICLIDFDAARMPKDDLEQDTRLLGTRGYAPPEQYGFSQTDARADIYSMGVMLTQLMEGQIYRRRYRRVVKKMYEPESGQTISDSPAGAEGFLSREAECMLYSGVGTASLHVLE